MGWSGRLEKASFLSILLSILSAIGAAPSYNVALPLFCLVATHTQSGKLVVAALVGLFVSAITDVLWAVINHAGTGFLYYFTLLLTLGNLAVKVAMFLFATQLFVDLGGTVSLLDDSVPIEGSTAGSFSGGRTPGQSFGSDFDPAGTPGGYTSYQPSPASASSL